MRHHQAEVCTTQAGCCCEQAAQDIPALRTVLESDEEQLVLPQLLPMLLWAVSMLN